MLIPCFFVLGPVPQVRVKLLDPLLVHLEEHEGVRVSLVIIHALELADIYWVSVAPLSENRALLGMDAAQIDGLTHAF